MHHSLPDFIMTRGGVSLRPGDGIIHSWLNRMLMPDTVGSPAIRTPDSRSAFRSLQDRGLSHLLLPPA